MLFDLNFSQFLLWRIARIEEQTWKNLQKERQLLKKKIVNALKWSHLFWLVDWDVNVLNCINGDVKLIVKLHAWLELLKDTGNNDVVAVVLVVVAQIT